MRSDSRKGAIGIILLLAISPLISMVIAAILSAALGCSSGAAGIRGCAFSSFNSVVEVMVSLGYLAIITVPLGFLAIIVIALNAKK